MQIVIGFVTIFIISIGFLLFKHLKENISAPPNELKDISGFLASNIDSILLVMLFIFGIIIITTLYDWNLNTIPNDKNKKKKLIYESMTPKMSFCSNTSKKDLKPLCEQLSENNCNSVGCCVFLNNEKCVPGNKHGPTFLNDKVDNYYYKNKCYGNCN